MELLIVLIEKKSMTMICKKNINLKERITEMQNNI